jgi:hypothetical protein
MDVDASTDLHLPAESVIAAASSHIPPPPSLVLPDQLTQPQNAPSPMQSNDRQSTSPEPLIQSPPKMRRRMMSMQPTIALDAESTFVAARDARPASPVRKMTEQRDLGLYDDPEDFDDIHNDPLSHNSAFDGDEDEGVDMIVPPADIQVPHDEDTGMNHERPTLYPPPRPLRDIYLGCHETWWARVVIALVAFLHTKHRLSFRGCALLLFCLNTIFTTLALLPSTQNLPLTLNTVIHRLDLDDRFTIHPVCKSCHRIFSTDIPIDSSCPDCETKLFKPVSDSVFQRITGRQPKRPPPVCAAPIHLPSSLLVDFLARAEIEKACDSWKRRARVPGKINDISEGRIWTSLKDKEGNLFFSKDSASEDLHLGITLSLDW